MGVCRFGKRRTNLCCEVQWLARAGSRRRMRGVLVHLTIALAEELGVCVCVCAIPTACVHPHATEQLARNTHVGVVTSEQTRLTRELLLRES